jgi:acyl-coenzyme A synthetase/AMP-(fatty) acid ligase
MSFELPESLNIADVFLDARLREQGGERVAIVTDQRSSSYAEVQALSNRFANVLARLDVRPEERVLIGLPDLPEFVGALFGTLKNGSVVVMVNCQLKSDEIRYFYEYTRARLAVVYAEHLAQFSEAARDLRELRHILVSGPYSADAAAPAASGKKGVQVLSLERELESAGTSFDNYPTHRDDPAIWLFSGGTTGRPKAVIQTHGSFANTTELYAKRVLGYSAADRTLSVPKLYFGYATGCNLFFPFATGGSAILFPERCTADVLFEKIRRHRPTILINVPTMVNHMVNHPLAGEQDLSCLRLATSAGEALPAELYARFKQQFGVELLDGLGTAEMWHVFVSNRPGDVTPGTLGKVVSAGCGCAELRARSATFTTLPRPHGPSEASGTYPAT